MADKEKQKPDVLSDPQPHTFAGLRDVLFDEINLLRAGKISISRARVTSQLARRVIETVTLDMFARKELGNGEPKELKRLMKPDVI